MLDTGANPNCFSLLCVLGSEYLRNLPRHEYAGNKIVDANGQPMQPSFVLKCNMSLGSPEVNVYAEFVEIKWLPFSCILGQKTLKSFSSWEVLNENQNSGIWKKTRSSFL